MISYSLQRPDGVTRTSVLQPYDLSTTDPVNAARNVITAFANAAIPAHAGIGQRATAEDLSGCRRPVHYRVDSRKLIVARANASAPRDKLRPGVVAETVGRSAMYNYYAPENAARRALSDGNWMDVSRTQAALVAAYGIRIPGKL